QESRLEPHPISESIWRAVIRGGVSTVRLYAGGDLSNWDVAVSPLRFLAFRLTGQNVRVKVVILDRPKQDLEITSLSALAGLSEHPDIDVIAVPDPLNVGDGYLIAEALGSSVTKWAVRDGCAIEFDSGWGRSADSLVKVTGGEYFELSGEELSFGQLLPPPRPGDLSVDIGSEIDGPVQRFGNSFWNV